MDLKKRTWPYLGGGSSDRSDPHGYGPVCSQSLILVYTDNQTRAKKRRRKNTGEKQERNQRSLAKNIKRIRKRTKTEQISNINATLSNQMQKSNETCVNLNQIRCRLSHFHDIRPTANGSGLFCSKPARGPNMIL